MASSSIINVVVRAGDAAKLYGMEMENRKGMSLLDETLQRLRAESTAREWKAGHGRRCVLVQQKAMHNGDWQLAFGDVACIAEDPQRFADFMCQGVIEEAQACWGKLQELQGKRPTCILIDELTSSAKPFTPGLLCVTPIRRNR